MNSQSENYRTGAGLKKKRVRRLVWTILGSLFLLIALLIAALYGILNAPWFRVRTFDVSDLPGISRNEILDAMKTQMSGGYLGSWLGPDNVLFWKFGRLPAVLFRLPAIKAVSLEAGVFDRAVKIGAEKRNLWGVICDKEDSNCFGLDENGMVFSRVPDVSGSLILKINDSGGRIFILGRSLFPKTEWFSNFKNTIDTLNGSGYRVIRVELGDISLREWTARVAGGLEFYFGLEFAPENLTSILKDLNSRIDLDKTTYVDFRVPNRIYYK